MDRPPPSPAKLLDAWMEWERGDALPGRTMSTLKTGGLRVLLEEMVAAASPATGDDVAGVPAADAAAWTPVV